MKKTAMTITLVASALSVGMNSVKLHADELLTRDRFFVADESRHEWVNERNGRTGILEVRGALLASPCSLQTGEVSLPLQVDATGGMRRYPLALDLTGCGYGGSLTSADSPAGRTSVMVVYSGLLSGRDGGIFSPEQRMLGTGQVVLHGGAGRLTWYLSDVQRQMLAPKTGNGGATAAGREYRSDAVLRLRLDYE